MGKKTRGSPMATPLTATVPCSQSVHETFVKYPDRVTAGVAVAIALCAFANFAQAEARFLKKHKIPLPTIIELGDNSKLLSFMGTACLTVAAVPIHGKKNIQVIESNGKLLSQKASDCIRPVRNITCDRNAIRRVDLLPLMVLTATVYALTIKAKYNRCAMALCAASELGSFYLSAGHRKAVHNLVNSNVPEQITTEAEARALLSIDESLVPKDRGDKKQFKAYQKLVRQRCAILTSFIYTVYDSRLDHDVDNLTTLTNYRQFLKDAERLLLTPNS
jgi:hypothetical protein